MKEFYFDTHIHTTASGHAYSTITENARAASQRGIEMIAITDHSPGMPGGPHVFHFYNLRILPLEIEGVRILRGAEVNIIDKTGTIDLIDEVIDLLDIVIASLHPPCIKPTGDMTEAILGAMANPAVSIIGHPGDDRYPFDIPRIVRASGETGTLLEVNNSSLLPTSFRLGGPEIIRKVVLECKKQGVPLVAGSDAHVHTAVGDFAAVTQLMRETDFPDSLLVNKHRQGLEKYLLHGQTGLGQ